jgi:regulatory protein
MPKGEAPERKANVYVVALTMLSRRELSEKQVRERLVRRGYDGDEIEHAVERLKSERAIDDARVAAAIARSQISVRGRGKIRVRMAIQQAGIRGDAVNEALESAFGDVDQDALLTAALNKRLRGERPIADDREFQRLYRYLVGQGFESDKALKALNARRSR